MNCAFPSCKRRSDETFGLVPLCLVHHNCIVQETKSFYKNKDESKYEDRLLYLKIAHLIPWRRKLESEPETQKKYPNVFPTESGKFKVVINHKHRGTFNTAEEASEAAYELKRGTRTVNGKQSASGIKGITFEKRIGKWSVRKNGVYLGKFNTLEEAQDALMNFMERNGIEL